jgi:hypothetical protein
MSVLGQLKSAGNGIKKAASSVRAIPGIGGAAIDLGLNSFANMQSGDSASTAVIKAIPESIAWAVSPGVMTVYTAAQLLPVAMNGYMTADRTLSSKYNRNHSAGTMFTYQDTNQAVTMRQAAVQAIQGSKMNARNALGGEAALMHRNWADVM